MATETLIDQFEFAMPFSADIGIGMEHGDKCHQTFSLHDVYEYGTK